MISGFSPHALDQLQGALGGGGSPAVVIDFDRLAAEVAQLRQVADRIATTVANPTWAAGDEMCRRAATALQHEWYEDAERDARASTEAFPYRAAPHLLRAIALLHLGDSVAAFEAFEASIKYGKETEPGHAATAGLVAAQLASAAGAHDRAGRVLQAADHASGGRCPQVLVEMAKHGLASPSPDRVSRLLCDDPGAWLDLDVSDTWFGPDAQTISSAYLALVAAIASTANEAEAFHGRASAISRDAFEFYSRLYDSGDSRYWSPEDGHRQYLDGGAFRLLRPLVARLEALTDTPLAVRVCAGISALRYMAYRIPSRQQLPAAFYGEHVGDLLADAREQNPALDPSEPALDVLVQDWGDLRWDMRREDRPRRVGNAEGTGIYLRSVRARWQYDRDHPDVTNKLRTLEATPRPRGFRPKPFELAQYDAAQAATPSLRTFLATSPPDISSVRDAISNWYVITRGSGQSVVRPLSLMLRSPLAA